MIYFIKIVFIGLLLSFATILDLQSQDSLRIDSANKAIQALHNSVKELKEEIDKEKGKQAFTNIMIAASLIVSIVALLAPFLEHFNNKKVLRLQALIEMYTEFRSEEWTTVRRKLREKGKDISWAEVERYSFLLNHFGFLLEHGYVEADQIFDKMGKGVIFAWETLQDKIIEIRSTTGRELHQYHFEYLQLRMRQVHDERIKHITELMIRTRAATSRN